LIAELEKRGIGRPSTFATLVSTILDRDYVEKTNVEGTTQDSRHLCLQPNQFPPKQTLESHKVGAEKNKMRATALGRSITTYLTKEYGDLFDYAFTAKMEQNLDEIARATKPWKSLLQETWDTYKDRYTEHTSGTQSKAARERVLGEHIKVILSKKGPLVVKESTAEGKATFASLPTSCSFETATYEDAVHAFQAASAAKQGDTIGMLETEEIRKKKGPYGEYLEWKGIKIPYKEETLEQTQERFQAKQSSQTEAPYCRTVGDFTIKKGPYGLYVYKHTLKKAQFVSFPKALDPEKVNAVDLQGLYSEGIKKKKYKRVNKIETVQPSPSLIQ
jgi:DNA topoisomerase-1